MVEVTDIRPWNELVPDVLCLIFRNLLLKDLLIIMPRVCKSWAQALMGPYCWHEIDIEEWSKNKSPEKVDKMVQMLIKRSCGSFRKLCVSRLSGDASFSLIAGQAKSLQILRLPSTEVNNSTMKQLAPSLSSLTFLDVSYCYKIGAQALEEIGNHCKTLTRLRRVLNPYDTGDKLSHDDEAYAIAATMPKLKQVEISHLCLSTKSVLEILANCRELELLDVQGCWDVNLDDKFLKQFLGLKVLGPDIEWYDSIYTAWDFVPDCCCVSSDDDDDGNDDDEEYVEYVLMLGE